MAGAERILMCIKTAAIAGEKFYEGKFSKSFHFLLWKVRALPGKVGGSRVLNKSVSFVAAGTLIGVFIGSSMGIAAGGTAYNAAFFFGPLGAFIGWLLPNKLSTPTEHTSDPPVSETPKPEPELLANNVSHDQSPLTAIATSLIMILATVWNFHIDLLGYLRVLPYFLDMPIFFVGLCLIITMLFPPFLLLYFAAWLSANHFGLHKKNQYRAIIK